MKTKQLFTKWDLIVVLGCLGFIFLNLAAVGVRGRSNVKNMLCANNIKEQVRAQLLYGADNDGKFPTQSVEYPNRVRYRNSTGTKLDWYGALKKSVYLPESKILICPFLKAKAFYGDSSGDLSWLSPSSPTLYGAWDWEKNPLASNIPTGETPGDILIGGYAWFANWTTGSTNSKMVFNFTWTEPAPIGKTWNVNTEPFPKTLNDCKSNNAMITHLVWYNQWGTMAYNDLSH